MAHFIMGKYPNMEQMRETFAFWQIFFCFSRYLHSVNGQILRIRLCNRKYFHLLHRSFFSYIYMTSETPQKLRVRVRVSVRVRVRVRVRVMGLGLGLVRVRVRLGLGLGIGLGLYLWEFEVTPRFMCRMGPR